MWVWWRLLREGNNKQGFWEKKAFGNERFAMWELSGGELHFTLWKYFRARESGGYYVIYSISASLERIPYNFGIRTEQSQSE